MNYHYKGTYSFKTDADGSNPAGWTIAEDANAYVTIVAAYGGHAKVMQLNDTSAAPYCEAKQTFAAQVTGTIELCFAIADSTQYFRLGVNDTIAGIHISCSVTASGHLEALDSATWRDLGAITNATWYHLRIVFDCTADTYLVYLNGTEFGPYAYNAGTANMTTLQIHTYKAAGTVPVLYIDAVDYSWDTGYYLNRNKDLDMEGVYFDDVQDTNQSFYHYIQGVNELGDGIVIQIADPLMTLYSATYNATYLGKDIKIISDTKLVWQGRVNAIPQWVSGYVVITGEGWFEQFADRLITALAKYLTAVTNGLTTVQDLDTGQEKFTGYISSLDFTNSKILDASKAWTNDYYINWIAVIDTVSDIPTAEHWLSINWQASPLNTLNPQTVNCTAYFFDDDSGDAGDLWASTTTATLICGNDANSDAYRIYLRFPINIPRAAIISSCDLMLKVTAHSTDFDVYISLIAVSDCPAFPNGHDHETAYPATDTETPTEIKVTLTVDTNQVETIDIKTLLQAYIDRTSYVPGHYIGIKIRAVDPTGAAKSCQTKGFYNGSDYPYLNNIVYTVAPDKIQFKITDNDGTSLTLDSLVTTGLIVGSPYMIVPQTTKLAEIMATTWDLAATVATSCPTHSTLAIVKRFADGAKAKEVIAACRSLDGHIYRLRLGDNQTLTFTLKLPTDITSTGTLPLDIRKDEGCKFESPSASYINLIKAKDRYGTTITRAWNYTTNAPVNDAIVDLPANLEQREMFLPCPEYADATVLKNLMDTILKSLSNPLLSENLTAELYKERVIGTGPKYLIEPGIKVSIVWGATTYTDYIITRKEYDSQTKRCILRLVKYRA